VVERLEFAVDAQRGTAGFLLPGQPALKFLFD